MTIQERFNEHIREQQEKRKDRVGSGKIKPSGLGQCYRRQVYAIRQAEVTNPPDVASLKRMLLGTVIHETIQKAYSDDEKEVLVENDELKGYADIVGDDYVSDIKSVSPWAYKWLTKPNVDIAVEKKDNWRQVAVYGIILNKPKIQLAFVNTGNLNQIKEYEQLTEDWRKEVEEEIAIVTECLMNKTLPIGVPRLYGNDKEGNPRECQYCNYRNECFESKERQLDKVEVNKPTTDKQSPSETAKE